jgi:predicted nuclease of predicted toxin-antitoxin system
VRIKVDENIGSSGVTLLRERGHDVTTIREQGLGGSPDNEIFDVCAAEGRTLVTLDRDLDTSLAFLLSGRLVLSSSSWAHRPRRAFFTNVCRVF